MDKLRKCTSSSNVNHIEALAAQESFSFVWATALVWHLTWHGQWTYTWWHTVFCLSACGQMLWPLSSVLLLSTHSLAAVLFSSPSGANHEILFAFVGIGVITSKILNFLIGQDRKNSVILLRDTSLLRVFPIMRAYLLVLYAAAFFHKLNKDYLNPDISCAVSVTEKTLSQIIFNSVSLSSPWRLVLVHSSLILELFLPLSLAAPPPIPMRWRGSLRTIGVTLGTFFHVRTMLYNVPAFA